VNSFPRRPLRIFPNTSSAGCQASILSLNPPGLPLDAAYRNPLQAKPSGTNNCFGRTGAENQRIVPETPRKAQERNRRFNNTVVLESIRALKFCSAAQSNVDMVRQPSLEGTQKQLVNGIDAEFSWDLVV
jgi:hypothetical protein